MKIIYRAPTFLALALYAGLSAADFVVNDDLIVTNSACVGNDCVNGESFGFDTIRLKENNLRIKFQDTSNTASFPRNDWQITINDSENGGAEKFSIDDIDGGRTPFTIEARAPSHSLYVDDGGRLGLGTSIPVVDIHAVSGNTPTLRLEQNGSSGFAPQTWDVAGNETNFFVRDVTNGSTLPFKIRPGAPNNAIYIDTDGAVGLGTTSPDGAFHILGDVVVEETDTNISSPTARMHIMKSGDYQLRLDNRASGGGFWHIGQTDNAWQSGGGKLVFVPDTTASGSATVSFENDGDVLIGDVDNTNADHDFEIHGTGSVFSEIDAGEAQFTVSSSRQLKENIFSFHVDDILSRITQVPVVTYDWKQDGWQGTFDSRQNKIGLIAEDFHTVLQRGSDKEINGSEVQMALWLAVQELVSEKQILEKRIAELEDRVAILSKQ